MANSLDWLFVEGGQLVFIGIALGLLGASSIFTFLLWRKGDADM
ncbi:MAG: hypothetical protein ACTSRS_11005 [Candidatus Helarchaeota archaeon]